MTYQEALSQIKNNNKTKIRSVLTKKEYIYKQVIDERGYRYLTSDMKPNVLECCSQWEIIN